MNRTSDVTPELEVEEEMDVMPIMSSSSNNEVHTLSMVHQKGKFNSLRNAHM